ncbi:MAG TPA: NUDIX domain-containing protein [Fimbriimonadaceae bacterium]|nr:NUDIX domain-containing protein [Fimbriimonadaceae bacterium]
MRQIQRIASYAIVVREGKILLCRISKQLPGDVGRWTLPGGGIDFGEHPQSAAVREVREETGYGVRLAEVLAVDSEVFHHEDRQAQAVRIIYRAEIVEGDLASESHGSTDLCGWFTEEEARRLPLVNLARRGIDLAFCPRPN